MKRIKSFNRKIIYLSTKNLSLLTSYDIMNTRSHKLDSDCNLVWIFNPLLNNNMFRFIGFDDGSWYMERDNVL